MKTGLKKAEQSACILSDSLLLFIRVCIRARSPASSAARFVQAPRRASKTRPDLQESLLRGPHPLLVSLRLCQRDQAVAVGVEHGEVGLVAQELAARHVAV